MITAKDIDALFKGMGITPGNSQGLMGLSGKSGCVDSLLKGSLRIKSTGTELYIERFVWANNGRDRDGLQHNVIAISDWPVFDAVIPYGVFRRTIAAFAKTTTSEIMLAVEGDRLALHCIAGNEYYFEFMRPIKMWPASPIDTVPVKQKRGTGILKPTIEADFGKLVTVDNQGNEMRFIDTTGVYFKDLARAREVGAIAANDPNPRKAVLYDLINDWNGQARDVVIGPEADSESEFDCLDLVALDEAEDQAAAAAETAAQEERERAKQERSAARKLKKPARFCKGFETVWAPEAIGAVRRGTNNGKVLEALFRTGVKTDDYEKLGIKGRKQVSQAVLSISEKGYGISKAKDGTYFLVLPEGMEEPKFA